MNALPNSQGRAAMNAPLDGLDWSATSAAKTGREKTVTSALVDGLAKLVMYAQTTGRESIATHAMTRLLRAPIARNVLIPVS